MGNRDAAQIQVVGLLALGSSPRLPKSRRSSKHRNQALSNSRRNLFPHHNPVRRCNTDGVSPNTAVICNIHRFQGDLQLVTLCEVVSCHNRGHPHLATSLLQVQVWPVVLARCGKWTDRQRRRIAQRIRYFIGQGETQKISGFVGARILERQHRDRPRACGINARGLGMPRLPEEEGDYECSDNANSARRDPLEPALARNGCRLNHSRRLAGFRVALQPL